MVNCLESKKLLFEINRVTSLEIIILNECTKMVEISAIKELEMTNMHAQKDSIFL